MRYDQFGNEVPPTSNATKWAWAIGLCALALVAWAMLRTPSGHTQSPATLYAPATQSQAYVAPINPNDPYDGRTAHP